MKNNFYAEAFHLLRENDKENYKINFILSKKNEDNSIGFIAYATHKDDIEDMVYVSSNIDGYAKSNTVADWSFNVDDDLFENLEQNFNIEYMSLNTHYGVWCAIEELYPFDIEHDEGMQQYLTYCHQNEITEKVVNMENGSIGNMMQYYQERNADFKIIARTDIGGTSIVLAKRNSQFTPYVTWRTTPHLKNGYDIGHYFENYREAIDDYKERCRTLLEIHLDRQRALTKPRKEKLNHER